MLSTAREEEQEVDSRGPIDGELVAAPQAKRENVIHQRTKEREMKDLAASDSPRDTTREADESVPEPSFVDPRKASSFDQTLPP